MSQLIPQSIAFPIWLSIVITHTLSAADYTVATDGHDDNPGTLELPLKTIQEAADRIEALGSPAGSTVYIRGGSYHEAVTINNTNGTAANPITFTAYDGESVLLDGTADILEIQATGSSGWAPHATMPNVYEIELDTDIWQLFADDEMQIPARWPNLNPALDIWQHWESTYWAEGRNERNFAPPVDTNGTMYDAPHHGIDLAASGLDLTGAIAILNVGSFRTKNQFINTHTPGSGTFTYDPVSIDFKDKEHFYFVEGKLELLDQEKEWFYNPDTNMLYAHVPGGGSPASLQMRGKTLSYAITATNFDYIVIDGIDFRGATFKLSSCYKARVQNCDLTFPSCTKRMLGTLGTPDTSLIDMGGGSTPSESVIYNCTFAYTDGHGLYTKGKANKVENCYFHHIDYSATELPSIMAAIYMSGYDNIFRQNTIHTFGASVAYLPGDRPVVEYNNIYDGGYVQHDGAIIQVMKNMQLDAQIGWNWVHDWPRLGVRFDGGGGLGGLVHHTVSWDCNAGVYIGNHENNEIISNSTIYSTARNEIVVESAGPANQFTITRNNIAPRIGGTSSGNDPIPGTHDHNWNGYVTGQNIRTQLRDPDNWDFRPIPGSDIIDAGQHYPGVTDDAINEADIGAYEFGADTYWIAGYRKATASTPIPLDGSTTAKGSAALIWHTGLDALSSDVYLGTDETAVTTATTTSPEFKGNLSNNIYDPLGLTAQTYYWRIDTVTASGTLTGEVWSFTPANVTVAAPGIVNTAATAVTTDSATIGGQITDGGTSSQVFIDWWAAGDEATPTTIDMGKQSYTFSTQLTNLIDQTTYYYRCRAVNTYGSTTAATTVSFIAETLSDKYATVHIPVTEDSWVQIGSNEDVNHEGEGILKVRGNTRFAYLKFDTGTLDGASFDSATIHLRTTQATENTSMHPVEDNTWTAATLKGENAPNRGAIFATVNSQPTDTWIEFDASTWVTAKGTWSVALSTTHSAAINWASKESENAPYIAVTYRSDTADVNSNGIVDWWESEHFGTIDAPGSEASTDSDLDGLDNEAEYIAGTDPNDPASVFKQVDASSDATDFSLEFPSSLERIYTLQTSSTLQPNSWIPVEGYEAITGTGSDIVVEIPLGTGAKFYRVSVTMPIN